MQPIHSGKIASELQRQAYKVCINTASSTLKQRASEGLSFHSLGAGEVEVAAVVVEVEGCAIKSMSQ